MPRRCWKAPELAGGGPGLRTLCTGGVHGPAVTGHRPPFKGFPLPSGPKRKILVPSTAGSPRFDISHLPLLPTG